MSRLLWLLLALPGLASAVEPTPERTGFDAHGFVLAPDDGDLDDLLMTWRAQAQTPGALGFQGLFEYANAPLVLFEDTGGDRVRDPLLAHVGALNLGAHVGLHERVGLAASAPLYLMSVTDQARGPAFGDVRLSVPVTLLLNESSTFGASLVPFGVLPTGPAFRFLGQGTFAGGGLLALSARAGPVGVSANAGAMTGRPLVYENLEGGPRLLTGLGASYEVTERLALRAEGRFEPILSPNRVPLAESPGEVVVSARGHAGTQLYWTAGLGSAVTPGVSASPLRAFFGIGLVQGKGWVKPVQIVPAQVRFTAVNPRGAPVAGVEVRVNGEPVCTTDAEGACLLPEREPGVAVEVSAVGPEAVYAPYQREGLELVEGAQAHTISLAWTSRPVRAVAVDPAGDPVAANVRLIDADRAPRHESALGDDGAATFEVQPGTWTAAFSAPEHEGVRTPFEVEPGAAERVVEVEMVPVRVEVTEETIEISDQIHFDFDRATIRPASFSLLDEIAETILAHPHVERIEIQGHTSSEGGVAYNERLSEERAESVRRALVERGVDPLRLTARGLGPHEPIASNDTAEGREQNRRVEFHILE